MLGTAIKYSIMDKDEIDNGISMTQCPLSFSGPFHTGRYPKKPCPRTGADTKGSEWHFMKAAKE